MMKFIPHPRLDEGDGEKIQEDVENRGDTEKTFAQSDEGGDVLNPVRIQVLQLQPVMLQQHMEKLEGG
jgi:hypothetical protein